MAKKTISNDKIWDMGSKWGDAINWFSAKSEDRRIVGWKTPKPKVGDYLRCRMQSGRNGIFRFTKIEPQSNPSDMFFADVEDFGYEDELCEIATTKVDLF